MYNTLSRDIHLLLYLPSLLITLILTANFCELFKWFGCVQLSCILTFIAYCPSLVEEIQPQSNLFDRICFNCVKKIKCATTIWRLNETKFYDRLNLVDIIATICTTNRLLPTSHYLVACLPLPFTKSELLELVELVVLVEVVVLGRGVVRQEVFNKK